MTPTHSSEVTLINTPEREDSRETRSGVDAILRVAHAHNVTTVVPMTHPFQEVRGEFSRAK